MGTNKDLGFLCFTFFGALPASCFSNLIIVSLPGGAYFYNICSCRGHLSSSLVASALLSYRDDLSIIYSVVNRKRNQFCQGRGIGLKGEGPQSAYNQALQGASLWQECVILLK